MTAPVPDRTRYAPAVRSLMDTLDQEGLMPALRSGRTHDLDQVMRLSGLGIVSSSRRRLGVGKDFWRLAFTKGGRLLRKVAQLELAR